MSAHIKLNKDQIEKQLPFNIDLAAITIFPDDYIFKFPAFYVQLFLYYMKIAMDTSFRLDYEALALPRGHAKSFVIKMMCVIMVFFTHRNYILIVGSNEDKASEILSDVKRGIFSENMQTLFGDRIVGVETDRADLLVLRIKSGKKVRPVILRAFGWNGDARGISRENKRPDVMIFDDAQTAKCAESLSESRAFQREFYGKFMKAKSPKQCMYLYIGNMYPDKTLEDNPKTGQKTYTCQLRNLMLSKQWKSLITSGILADGSALWEDLHPVDRLLDEGLRDLSAGQWPSFAAEVLNDPKAAVTKVIQWDHLKVSAQPAVGRFLIVDPSLGRKKSDRMPVVCVEYLPNRTFRAVDILFAKGSQDKQVSEIVQFSIATASKAIYFEAYALQSAIITWTELELNKNNIKDMIYVGGITRGGLDKNSAILSGLGQINSGKIQLMPKVKKEVQKEAEDFDHTSRVNADDVLDCIGYLQFLELKDDFQENIRLLDERGIIELANSFNQSGSGAVKYEY